MAKIVLEDIRVDFPIYATQRSLRTAIFRRATGGLIQRHGKNQERVVVKALAGVSMTLEDGDRLGLIGHNGSGKSTLLKVIAGIYEPIEGRLRVDGRVTPLFDMMPGLDPEDSGYENIITAGMLLGMSRDAIEGKIPEIEEFSELGEYLSLPVRTYSTGMSMRLGFAIVTHLDPGILLMDEGIGAGDARFAERAEQQLNKFVGRSRIVVMASHAPSLIRSICNKAALMSEGRLVAIGPVEEIIGKYDAMLHRPPPAKAAGAEPESKDEHEVTAAGEDWAVAEFTPAGRMGSEYVECLGGSVETLDGAPCKRPDIQSPFRICLRYRLLRDSPLPLIPNFHFFDGEWRPMLLSLPLELPSTGCGDYTAYCRIDPFTFNTGRYSVGLALSSGGGPQPLHFFAESALRFVVTEPRDVDPRRHGYADAFPGMLRIPLQWHFARHGDGLDDPSASDSPKLLAKQS